MLETIMELEKSKKRGANIKSGAKDGGKYFPKKFVIGNKKDLKK
jgi:hypothetical protein